MSALLVAVIGAVTGADIEATSADGRRFVLHQDGRWSEAPAAPPPPPADAAPQALAVEYDRFANTLEIATPPIQVADSLKAVFFYVVEGRQPKKAKAVHVLLSGSSPSWRFLTYHDLNFLADGKRLPVAKVDHDGDVGSGYVFESVMAELSVSTIEALAKAKDSRGRLGSTEFELPTQLRAALGALADVARDPKKAPPAKEN
jgi:hypothetical protein